MAIANLTLQQPNMLADGHAAIGPQSNLNHHTAKVTEVDILTLEKPLLRTFVRYPPWSNGIRCSFLHQCLPRYYKNRHLSARLETLWKPVSTLCYINDL